MRLGHANFIHPQLGRLVGVKVVNTGCHSNDHSAVDGNGKVVPWICQELGRPFSIHRTVKDIGGDGIEHRQVIGPEYSDRNVHSCELTHAAYSGRAAASAARSQRIIRAAGSLGEAAAVPDTVIGAKTGTQGPVEPGFADESEGRKLIE